MLAVGQTAVVISLPLTVGLYQDLQNGCQWLKGKSQEQHRIPLNDTEIVLCGKHRDWKYRVKMKLCT